MDRKEFFIDVPYGKISVVTYGSEKLPLVICCHGRGDSADTFLPLIRLLPTNYHYVTFDLPGCGYSDKVPPGNVLTTFTFLPSFKLVADHYGEDTPFIFIGHSMGTQIGLLYHICCPKKRITKVVDIDNLTYHPVELEKQRHNVLMMDGGGSFPEYMQHYYYNFSNFDFYRKMNSPLENAPSYTKQQALDLLMNVRQLTPAAAEVILKRNLRPDPKDPNKFKLVWDQRHKYIARPPFTNVQQIEVLKRYKVPVLYFAATDTINKHLTPFVQNVENGLREHLPYFEKIIIEGVHDLHVNTPQLLAPHISRFLKTDFGKIEFLKRYKLPMLYFVATDTIKKRKTPLLQNIWDDLKEKHLPYFEKIIIEGIHDLPANTPELLAPHISRFLKTDFG